MYLPVDIGRYPKAPGHNQIQAVLNSNILPIQNTDPNAIYTLNQDQFSFENLDGVFKPSIGIRISRTPLSLNDPSTYASFSKFVEQNLRKYHTTLGNVNLNNLNNPVSIPPESVGVQDSKTEVLPIGCAINPLISDPFKQVHLTPGCYSKIITWGNSNNNNRKGNISGNASSAPTSIINQNSSNKNPDSPIDNSPSSSGFSKIWSRSKGTTSSSTSNNNSSPSISRRNTIRGTNNTNDTNNSSSDIHQAMSNSSNASPLANNIYNNSNNKRSVRSTNFFDNLKCPKSNLSRTSSTFINRVHTTDSLNKKLNNSNSLLVSCHGRLLNLIILEDNPREMEVELPALKVSFTTSIITTFDTFTYITSNGDCNLDILIGFATGDIVWINPIKMKYSRWNKNAKLKQASVISIKWSNCGNYAIIGYSDGEMQIYNRDFDDNEDYKNQVNNKMNKIKNEKFVRFNKSLIVKKDKINKKLNNNNNNNDNELLLNDNINNLIPHDNNSLNLNPIAHYKMSTNPITDINFHPKYSNLIVISCDDGFTRLFDLIEEKITDIIPAYYGGLLCNHITNDGKYLLVGGEDDLISIYEFQLSSKFSRYSTPGMLKLIARLKGSKSWIRQIKIDDFKTTTGILYRIGSVGDDGCLIFHEFSPRNLPKIRKHRVTNRIKHSSHQQQSQSQSQSQQPNSGNTNTTLERKLQSLSMKSMTSSSKIQNNNNSIINDLSPTSTVVTSSELSSITSPGYKQKVISRHKHTGSISSLTSSTNPHLSLFEVMNSNSQTSLNNYYSTNGISMTATSGSITGNNNSTNNNNNNSTINTLNTIGSALNNNNILVTNNTYGVSIYGSSNTSQIQDMKLINNALIRYRLKPNFNSNNSNNNNNNNNSNNNNTHMHSVYCSSSKCPVKIFRIDQNYETVVHGTVGLKDCPILLPIGVMDLQLGRMSGLDFDKDYVWGFCSTGDSIRWKRP
ncbi:hypothetical protein B5S28_g3841 [[Candida] boidinii]|nr:hypothetical protein B5S28_g3841 [[Candida] boidinii]